MSVAFVEAFATDFLEYQNFVSSDIICENSSLYDCALYIRSTYLNCTLVIYEKYLSELHSCTLCLRKTVAKDFIACLDFELLACNINNSVHKIKLC